MNSFPRISSRKTVLEHDPRRGIEESALVNGFGRGVLNTQESLKRNGNEPARFAFDPASVTVRIGASRRFTENPR